MAAVAITAGCRRDRKRPRVSSGSARRSAGDGLSGRRTAVSPQHAQARARVMGSKPFLRASTRERMRVRIMGSKSKLNFMDGTDGRDEA
jgi:hypothetical protein